MVKKNVTHNISEPYEGNFNYVEAQSCTELPDSGSCYGYFPRYYYDTETKTCRRFIYGGCGGNTNRYMTESDCMNNCKASYENACEAPPDSGPCLALFQKYYFDPTTKTCKIFAYGGCRGNANRYSTESGCLQNCLGRPRNIYYPPDERMMPPPNCYDPPETGPCRAAMPRYFYDQSTRRCYRFIYGGCLGNENNYKSADECYRVCHTRLYQYEETYPNF